MSNDTRVPPLTLLGEGAEHDLLDDEPEAFVPSGLRSLDELVLGAVAGELTVLAGQAGQGKTSLAVQWAMDAAERGIPSAILSLEMGRRALRNRIISGLTGIDMSALRTRRWESDDQRKLALDAAEHLATLPLYVDDRSGLSGDDTRATLEEWAGQGIGFAVVDYLQQMGGANESRVVQVGDAVRAVKSAAMAADLPVVLLSSLNRSSNLGGTPRTNWLRDSGDIEFVADTILMLHYPDDDLYEDRRHCVIHCVKQRNGPTGVAAATFDKKSTRFLEPKW